MVGDNAVISLSRMRISIVIQLTFTTYSANSQDTIRERRWQAREATKQRLELRSRRAILCLRESENIIAGP